MSNAIVGYVAVQHSAYGYAGDPMFSHALETRGVTAAQSAAVVAAGGMVFPSYVWAENAADEWQYPADAEGILPGVSGTFVALKIDGLRVYRPVTAAASAPGVSG